MYLAAALMQLTLLSHATLVESFAFSSTRLIREKTGTGTIFSGYGKIDVTLGVSETNADSTSSFSAFAESLDEDELPFGKGDNGSAMSTNGSVNEFNSWQQNLESLLDPSTPVAKRQILLNDLMSSNEDIRNDVLEALSERKIDSILTPTGKKLQDGTRAVARQITNDIIPGLASSLRSSDPGSIGSKVSEELPTLFPKIGNRILDATLEQARRQLTQLQEDLADPRRIPERIQKQTSDIATEVRNAFSDTPEGLVGPSYKVVERGIGYEIREYEAYSAAATSMAKIGEPYSLDDITSGGAAFNALAAYIFGANEQKESLDMTTPVSTTNDGEMRFYLKKDSSDDKNLPTPLAVEDSLNEKGAVKLIDVAPARLAVARFTGFVTDGEVARQKDALLNSLAIDEVEIDVPHGTVVPYLVFQYNPPYTIPIVRRNEVAIPVRAPGTTSDLKEEWSAEISDDVKMIDPPSDVE